MAFNGEVRPLELENPFGLRVRVREQGTTIAIEMAGEWDLAGRDHARHAIVRALAGRPECVLLDLSRLEFIDSSGLHAAIELAQRSAAQNVRLVIIPGPRAVQRVFEITGLLERLPFIDEQPSQSRAASSG
jgi:anti-sigma B factor antagonist